MRLGDEPFDYFQSRVARKNRPTRLEFADFKLHLVFFRFAHVGRVGNYNVKAVPSKSL